MAKPKGGKRGNPGVWGTAGSAPVRKTPSGPAYAPVGRPYPGFMTPQQMAAAARAQADADIKAQQALIESARQQVADQMRLAYDRQIAAGMAMGDWIKKQNYPGQIQGIFGGLASDQASLAKGYAGAARAGAEADAAQIGRMNAGLGVDSAVRNEGQGIADVTYGLGGALPAQALNTSGANYAAAATNLPAYAVQAGQFFASQEQAKAASALDDIVKQSTQLAAQRPKLVSEYQKEQWNIQQDLFSQYQKQREFKYKQYVDQLNAEIAAGRLSVSQASVKLRQWQASQPDLQARTLANGQIQWFDANTGRPVGVPQGPRKPKSTNTPAAKAAAARVKQQTKLAESRDKELAKITGVPYEARVYLGVGDGGTVKKPKRTRAQLTRYLVRFYKRKVARFGVKDKTVVELVNQMVGAMPNDWFVGGVPAASSSPDLSFGG